MKHNDAVIRQYCRAVGKRLPLPAAQRRQLLAGLREEFTESAPGLHHAGRTDCPRRNTGRSCTGAFERNCARACVCLSEKAALAIYSGRCHNRSIRLLCCTHIWPGDDRSLCCIRRRAHCDLACNRLVRNRTITSGGHDMKTLKSTLALILLAAILVSSFCFPACAASAQSITYLEDGSYYITTITVFPSAQNGRAASSISGQKTRDYYSSSHEKLYSLSVIGHFTYTGNTATATNADYDYSVQVSTWSFVRGSASCTGASATASATFRHLTATAPASVTLTCSADGKLS